MNSGFWVFRGANVKRPKGLQTWRQVTVQKTTNMFYRVGRGVIISMFMIMKHPGVCTVTACRTYIKKVRKGGDFFYGKSGNENNIKSL